MRDLADLLEAVALDLSRAAGLLRSQHLPEAEAFADRALMCSCEAAKIRAAERHDPEHAAKGMDG